MLSVKKLLTKLLIDDKYKIQSGYKLGSSIASNSYGDFSITFPRAYSSAPIVLATLLTDPSSTSSENAKIELYVVDVTTTGATIRAFNSATLARTPRFNWVAVGKV